MAGFTLRGPAKLGATKSDEGALTDAVVARYSCEDGKAGQDRASEVLPARRRLWRLAEAYAPRALAAALRARCDPSDQTGRGGVQELRLAVADWLDPPRRCMTCARGILPGTEAQPCPALSNRTGRHGRRLVPLPCKSRAGRPLSLSRAVGRDGATLSLFTPVQVDPACAAAQKMLKHGGSSAYDLVVDRDCRVLFAATRPPPAPLGSARSTAATLPTTPYALVPPAVRPTLTAALRAFDRAVDRAVRANGRLVLGMQAKHFTPKGSVTRADLLQGGGDGLRRALLDFDPRIARIASYALGWIYQGMGAVFTGRDVVDVPDWARRLRQVVEEVGASAEALHGALDEASQWAVMLPPPVASKPGDAVVSADSHATGWALVAACHDLAAVVVPYVPLARARLLAKEARAARAAGKSGKPLPALADVLPEIEVHSLAALLVRAAVAKRGGQAERVRERLAQVVADALGLACKGPALLTALRCGASQVVVAAGDGERDDAGGGASDGGDSAGGPNRRDRVPEHLRSREDDAEELAMREEESRGEWAALHAALEALRASDPEAAEVVRRRHGMDGVGEAETFEAIASAPLRCTGRQVCRESARKMYRRALDVALKPAALADGDPGHEGDAEHEVNATIVTKQDQSLAHRGTRNGAQAHVPNDQGDAVHVPMVARDHAATQSALRVFAARRAVIGGTHERDGIVRRRPARAALVASPAARVDGQVERPRESADLDASVHA